MVDLQDEEHCRQSDADSRSARPKIGLLHRDVFAERTKREERIGDKLNQEHDPVDEQEARYFSAFAIDLLKEKNADDAGEEPSVKHARPDDSARIELIALFNTSGD